MYIDLCKAHHDPENKEGVIVIPILLMGKLSLRDLLRLTQLGSGPTGI